MYRRMVFNVLAKNCDDHTKNFAFRLKKDQRWEITPAYDVCHAYKPDHRWVSEHALSINGKRTGITKEDLVIVAKSMNIKRADAIIAEISKKVATWDVYAEITKVSPELKNAIKETLIKMH